jgi:hypothetical protein
MTDDRELVALLREYRPIGPPPELRDQILSAGVNPIRLRDWLPAAAAVVLAVAFYWLAGVERRLLSASMPAPSPSDREAAFVLEEPLQP